MTNELIKFLQTPNLCPRCYMGIDDDHDGDCAYCARLTEQRVAQIRMERLIEVAAKMMREKVH